MVAAGDHCRGRGHGPRPRVTDHAALTTSPALGRSEVGGQRGLVRCVPSQSAPLLWSSSCAISSRNVASRPAPITSSKLSHFCTGGLDRAHTSHTAHAAAAGEELTWDRVPQCSRSRETRRPQRAPRTHSFRSSASSLRGNSVAAPRRGRSLSRLAGLAEISRDYPRLPEQRPGLERPGGRECVLALCNRDGLREISAVSRRQLGEIAAKSGRDYLGGISAASRRDLAERARARPRAARPAPRLARLSRMNELLTKSILNN